MNIIEKIEEMKKDCETFLKDNNTNYESVMKNLDSKEYGPAGENNNWEGGRISALKDILELLEVKEDVVWRDD